jgi:hypothetical protein
MVDASEFSEIEILFSTIFFRFSETLRPITSNQMNAIMASVPVVVEFTLVLKSYWRLFCINSL